MQNAFLRLTKTEIGKENEIFIKRKIFSGQHSYLRKLLGYYSTIYMKVTDADFISKPFCHEHFTGINVIIIYLEDGSKDIWYSRYASTQESYYCKKIV